MTRKPSKKKEAAAKAFKAERKRWSKVKGNQPTRSEAYKAFVREFPCAICWGFPGVYQPSGTCQIYWQYEYDNGNPSQRSPTEHAHIGNAGMRRKSSDLRGINLCGHEHHREGERSIHKLGRKQFEQIHGLDIEALIVELNKRFREKSVDSSKQSV